MTPTIDPPRVPGKAFVPAFLIALAMGMAASLYMIVKLKPIREQAYGKTFPLMATLTTMCREPGGKVPFDLHELAHCTARGQLEFDAKQVGTSVKSIGWAIVGRGANDVVVGQFQPGQPAVANLVKLPSDTYVLTFIVEDRPADLTELRRAIDGASGQEIPDRLVAIAQFATVQRHNGADVRTERVEFRVEDGAKD